MFFRIVLFTTQETASPDIIKYQQNSSCSAIWQAVMSFAAFADCFLQAHWWFTVDRSPLIPNVCNICTILLLLYRSIYPNSSKLPVLLKDRFHYSLRLNAYFLHTTYSVFKSIRFALRCGSITVCGLFCPRISPIQKKIQAFGSKFVVLRWMWSASLLLVGFYRVQYKLSYLLLRHQR